MPGLINIKKLRRTDFPLVLSVVLYVGIFFERSGIINFEWLLFSQISFLLCALVYLLISVGKRIINSSSKVLLFVSAYFLVFSAFFTVAGQEDYIFYLFFILQVLISSILKELIFPLLITCFYAKYFFLTNGASKRHGNPGVVLFSCFLMSAAFSASRKGDLL
jgi:hypothetical protein